MARKGLDMDERIRQVHDHMTTLRAEADAIRLAHPDRLARPEHIDGHGGPSRSLGLRRRAGRALMALGAFVEGHAESEGCPDGVAAARS